MDAQELEFLQTAVPNINEYNAELMERMAEWAFGVRDRITAWLWFLLFVAMGMIFAARAGLSTYIVIAALMGVVPLFEWILRKKAQTAWQRHDSARGHLQAVLESRKTLQGMAQEERDLVKAEIRNFLPIHTFLPGGLEHPVFWEDVEGGVMHS
jgi:hypothetical protein